MDGTGEAGEGTEDAGGAAPDPAAGSRRPLRPIVVGAGVIAGVVLIGGVALAARGGDPSPSPAADAETSSSERSTSSSTEPVETTATTLAPTTEAPPATEPAPTGAPPSSRPAGTTPPARPSAPRVATCSPYWPPPGGPLPTVAGSPGKSVAFGPPAPSCVNEAGGCMVSVVLAWSDGYTEVGSAVLAEPGSYTVNGDRGTTWNFTVTDDRGCISNGGNYSNVWPPGT